MRLVEVISNTYEIDDETLLQYLNYCDEEDISPTFDNFLDWFDTEYYISDFLDSTDVEFESVNNSFRKEDAFKKEINELLNKRNKND